MIQLISVYFTESASNSLKKNEKYNTSKNRPRKT